MLLEHPAPDAAESPPSKRPRVDEIADDTGAAQAAAAVSSVAAAVLDAISVSESDAMLSTAGGGGAPPPPEMSKQASAWTKLISDCAASAGRAEA
eukprot:SAG22_NODE_11248_length_494_cov_0.640506_1_plen_94_part_10